MNKIITTVKEIDKIIKKGLKTCFENAFDKCKNYCDEIGEKLSLYKENNISPYDDERAGAILDIAMKKMFVGGGNNDD